jgi:hypothetical protein
MKKNSLLFLIITICLSTTAFSQDTLRLFGHKESQKTQPLPDTNVAAQPKPVKYNDPDGIQTLTGPGRNVGFYFGLHSEYSQIAGYDAFGAGGTFAIIANHGLAIGISGKGFFSEPYEVSTITHTSHSYAGGYGGILIEPIIFPKYPVHISFPILLGGGGIARSVLYNYYYPYEYTTVYVENAEAFMIAEPGIEVEFNVARWMRLGLGASYRFTTTFEPSSFDSNPLNGFTGGFSLKFGKF